MNYEQYHWKGASICIPAQGLPSTLYVELSSRCNFSCLGCFRGSAPEDTEEDLPEDVMERILSSIDPKNGVKHLFLGGIGEPLLHPSVFSFIREASSAGAGITIQSNGSLMDDKMIQFLVEIGVEKCVISYETGGMGHAVQEEQLPGDEYLAGFPWSIIRKIRKARREAGKNKPFISMEWVLTSDSLADLKDFITTSIEEGVEELLFSNFLPVSKGLEDQILYSLDAPNEQGEFLTELLRRLRHRVHYTVPNFSLPTERYCNFIEKSSAVVRSDGSLAPCYRLLHNSREVVGGKEMELHPYIFGSLRDSSLEKLWNSRDYLWFRFSVENSLYPSCLDCPLREGCEYLIDSDSHCWGGTPSCGNCLWSRRIILCP